MDQDHLLPQSRSAFEEAFSLSTDILKRNRPSVIEGEGFLYKRPLQPQMLDTVLGTWAMDVLGAYVSEPELLLAHGIKFYRSRGTHQAVYDGIDLVGYDGNIETAPIRRRLWNKFQLGLYRARDNETPDLDNIHGVSQLAVAERSRMVRGFSGYDVRATETSYQRTSGSMLSADSGVRIETNPAKWSFGRRYDADLTLSQADLTALGVWIAPSTEPFTWATANFPWSLAGFPWGTPVNTVRKGLMAALLATKTCWVEFKDSGGAVLGYRRARAVHQVQADANGAYAVAATKYKPASVTAELIYIESMTDFGELNGGIAASSALRFGATPTDLTRPGLLSVGPTGLMMPFPAVATRPVSVPFGRTVRERIVTLLRIA